MASSNNTPNTNRLKTLKGTVLALTVTSLIGCASTPKLSLYDQEKIFNTKLNAALSKHKNVEMQLSEVAKLKAPTQKSKLKRDALITVEAMRSGDLRGKLELIRNVRYFIASRGIHQVPLKYQALAYLTGSVNRVADKNKLAVSEVRKQVNRYCGKFKYDAYSKSNDIEEVSRFKFNQSVSAACFAYVSGEPAQKVQLYMGKAANEGVTLPALWNEIAMPMQDVETSEYFHGKMALKWFEGKMRQHNINFSNINQ